MRYLTLDEALHVAVAVTGLSVTVIEKSSRIELLDSALAAPQASFGGEEFHTSFESKAAVLCVRIARNHPLLDGNKRLAWMCLRLFCDLNEFDFTFGEDDAVNPCWRLHQENSRSTSSANGLRRVWHGAKGSRPHE